MRKNLGDTGKAEDNEESRRQLETGSVSGGGSAYNQSSGEVGERNRGVAAAAMKKHLGMASLCSEMKYRSVVVIVVALSVMHSLMGIVSIILGTISSIQGVVWMAHRVSPIWSGVFFTVTGIAGMLSLRYQTPYITLCYAASTLVSFVSTIVCIQLSRLGLVNHTSDGHVYRKHRIDTLLLVTLGITTFECMVCVAGGFMSCKLNTMVKLKMLREGEGPFSVEMHGEKDVRIVPKKKAATSNNNSGGGGAGVRIEINQAATTDLM